MHLKIKVSTSEKLNNIRAVYAEEDIKVGELIEECPVVLIPDNEIQFIEKTVITKYEFNWDENHEALTLGYGSLYNHSDNPNVEFDQNYENKTMRFIALRDIKKGEELFIDYMQGTHGEEIPQEYLDYKH